MSEAALDFDFDSLLKGLTQNSLKTLIYGAAGSGKSANLASAITAYLAGGYTVIYLITEDNAFAGLRNGLAIYKQYITPYIGKSNFFIGDIRNDIAKVNKGYTANAKDAKATAIAKGGVSCLFDFLAEAPKVKNFLDMGAAKPAVNFRGLKNLGDLRREDKVLLIIDGFSRVDANTAGYAYYARGLRDLDTSPFAISGLQKGGVTVLKEAIDCLDIDLIVVAHAALSAVDLTDVIKDKDKQVEAKEKLALTQEQMQRAGGYPALGTSSTRESLLGSFGIVLHSEDTRLADTSKLTRYIYSSLDNTVGDSKDQGWYTRANQEFKYWIAQYAIKEGKLAHIPQNWLSSLFLSYLYQMNRLDEDTLSKLLIATKQKGLL